MYIGIDLGSTNIKAAAYDRNLNLIDMRSRPVVYIRENGFVEFDAEKYYDELVALLHDIVTANKIQSIAEMAFTGQAESLVVVDKNGKALSAEHLHGQQIVSEPFCTRRRLRNPLCGSTTA